MAYFTASCDTEDLNKKFAEELKLDYPILSDPEGKAATAYGIFNAQAKMAARNTFIIGKGGKILHIDEKVDVGKHGADVAERLEKLGVPKMKKDAE